MKRMFVVPIMVVSCCAGCLFFPGDGTLEITGTLQSTGDPPTHCTILLPELGDLDYYSREIGGVFDVDFVVAPRSATYRAYIVCPGYRPVMRPVHPWSKETPVNDLGGIALKKW
jgi:hypothetical protein